MSEILERFARLSPAKRNLLLSRVGGAALQLLAKLSPAPLTRMSVEEMNREAVLEASFDISGAAPPGKIQNSILLTGATGYLGAFLLEALLQATPATVHCLVRPHPPETAGKRILGGLDRYLREQGGRDRIVPLEGDLTLPNLGLEPRTYDELAGGIDAIFHCGAVVKWTYPYAALKPANVDGTREILRLAVRRRIKPLHFISTVGVFSSPDYPASSVMESDPLDGSGPLYVGYAQTKWVAEKLVSTARSRGLPVWIYRPNLCSDSRTGVFNPHDHISLLLKGCVQSGLTPDLNLRVSGAPVDFAARAIVSLSRMPAAPDRAYHLVNPNDISWNEFCQWFASQGYPLKRVSFPDWRQGILKSVRTDPGNALMPLLPFVSEHGFDYAKLPRFDCTDTSEQLRAAGLSCPPTDDAILRTWLRYYQESGYLKGARRPWRRKHVPGKIESKWY